MKMKLSLLCAATALAMMHGAHAANLSEDDQRFLREASESGMLEVQASQLAIQKAEHPDVKRYAEKMITEHTIIDQELKTLATDKGFQLPIQVEGGKQSLMEELRQLEGAGFDEEYVDEVAIDAHEDAVELFEDAAEDADDADIKAFASKHVPGLKKHLEMGRQLEDRLDGEDDRRETAKDLSKPTDTTGSVRGTVAVPGTSPQPAGQ